MGGFAEKVCVLNGAHPLSFRLVEEKRRRCGNLGFEPQCPKVFEQFRRPYPPYKLLNTVETGKVVEHWAGFQIEYILVSCSYPPTEESNGDREGETHSVQRPNTWAMCIMAPSAYLKPVRCTIWDGATTGLGVAGKEALAE